RIILKSCRRMRSSAFCGSRRIACARSKSTTRICATSATSSKKKSASTCSISPMAAFRGSIFHPSLIATGPTRIISTATLPISPHPAVPSADVSEPRQLEERRGEVEEKFGRLPALAVGYNMPQRHERDWYASALLDRVLHGGRAGRIHRALVLEKQIAIAAEGGMGFPDAFEYNGPTLGTTTIYHKPEYSPEATVAAFDEVIAEVCDKTLDADELEQIKVKCRADYFSMLESGGAGVPRFGLMHA